MGTGAFLEFLTGMQGSGLVGQVFRPLNFRHNKKEVAGSRPQGPVGQVSRGLGARAPRAWGPAHQGPGAFSPQKPPTSQITIFSQTSWWEPGEGVGVG